jgi:hypothetical protein
VTGTATATALGNTAPDDFPSKNHGVFGGFPSGLDMFGPGLVQNKAGFGIWDPWDPKLQKRLSFVHLPALSLRISES